MKRPVFEKVSAVTVLVVAIALLAVGAVRSHKVYDSVGEEFGILTFLRISDAQMVIDATFSGVLRKGERLYSTYDRTQPRGKQACPT